MGRNGHRAGAKHRGGRRGGRTEPERKPRAPDGGDDHPGPAPDPPRPPDSIRKMHEHDEPAGQRLGARPEPDHADGGESPELPPAEPRHRRNARDGPEPPGPRRGDARGHSRYVFAARCQDRPEAKEGQRRPREPARRDRVWSPSPGELEGIERRKLESKPRSQNHDNGTVREPLGHGVVGDPPSRNGGKTEPETPHRPLNNHNGAEAKNGTKRGDGGGSGHTGSAARGALWHPDAAAGRGPRLSQWSTPGGVKWPRWTPLPEAPQWNRAWWHTQSAPPVDNPRQWPRWTPPPGPLVPWNLARWHDRSAPHGEPWLPTEYRWARGGGGGGGGNRRTAAPWPGRGRHQFGPRGPVPHYQHGGTAAAAATAARQQAAWDDAWKAFIACSADPIEVARCLQIGNETDWGKLYAQFVCTAPVRTAAAPPFDRHASRIGKATAARLTAQF